MAKINFAKLREKLKLNQPEKSYKPEKKKMGTK